MAVTSPSPDCRPGPADAGYLLVLVVDDDERNLRLARDVLRAAACARWKRRRPRGDRDRDRGAAGRDSADLRLLDLDGVDAARELRGDPRTAEIPVVALSALQARGDEERLLAAGFAGYLEKPIDVGDFPGQVRGYCTDVAS